MDYAVVVFSVVVFFAIMIYFIKTFRENRITPERFNELKDEIKKILVKKGEKEAYDGMTNDQLLASYLALKSKKIKKANIIKLAETAVRLELMASILDKRGIKSL